MPYFRGITDKIILLWRKFRSSLIKTKPHAKYMHMYIVLPYLKETPLSVWPIKIYHVYKIVLKAHRTFQTHGFTDVDAKF